MTGTLRLYLDAGTAVPVHGPGQPIQQLPGVGLVLARQRDYGAIEHDHRHAIPWPVPEQRHDTTQGECQAAQQHDFGNEFGCGTLQTVIKAQTDQTKTDAKHQHDARAGLPGGRELQARNGTDRVAGCTVDQPRGRNR